MSPERVTFSGETVAACPDCDTGPVWRRDGDPQATSPEYEFACYECGWRGDDYRERDSRHNRHMDGNVKPRPGTLAYELAAADPDDLVTDGGVPQFDRVATGFCESCGDEVAVRWLDGGECVGCRERDELVTDGGQVVGRDPTAPTARVEAALKQLRLAKAATDDSVLANHLDDALFRTYNVEMYLEGPKAGKP